MITAAMDAARLGHVGPLPPALLRQAASGYLTARQRATDIDTWWDDALAYTARTLTGAVPALEPVPSAEGTGIAGVPGR